jgi:hypothetical protein
MSTGLSCQLNSETATTSSASTRKRSYLSGSEPVSTELARATGAIVDELKEWRFIDGVLVVDPTFTDPAYTWSWQGSEWARETIGLLAEQGIRQMLRYGPWRFQGMMASFEVGFAAGKTAALDASRRNAHDDGVRDS